MSQPTFRAMALASLILLAGCQRQADAPGEAPTGVAVAPGDGRVTVSWDQQPGLTYWIFYQAGGTVTAAATGVPLIFDAQSPRVVANLVNGTQYAFVMNATNRDSRAGPSSPVVLATTRLAGAVWIPGAPLGGQKLNGIAFGAVAVAGVSTNRIVAVGDSGTIFSGDFNYTSASPPVTSWAPATSIPAGLSDLSAVLYTGQFLALGAADGSVLTSTDGNTWTSANSIPNNGARMNDIVLGLVSGALRYVAVGAAGSIFTSADLIIWIPAVSTSTTKDLYSVSYLNGGFVATGATGTLLTSADASIWTVQTLGSKDLHRAAYGIGSAGAQAHYVVVGDAGTILSSTDGTIWNPGLSPPLSQNLRSVTFGSRFVAAGQGGTIAYSDDGMNWQLSSVAGAADLNAVVFAPAMYAAVGASGANAVSK